MRAITGDLAAGTLGCGAVQGDECCAALATGIDAACRATHGAAREVDEYRAVLPIAKAMSSRDTRGAAAGDGDFAMDVWACATGLRTM